MIKPDMAVFVSAASAVASTVSEGWTVTAVGVPFSVLMAGFAGALITLWVLPPTKHWYVPLAIGTVIATYLTPFMAAVVSKYTLLGDMDHKPIAFMIGLSANFLLTLFFKDGRDLIVEGLRAKLGVRKGYHDDRY